MHGGAWRDPDQLSTTIEPTLDRLVAADQSPLLERIAGVASINYRLSPYPDHPTSPSDAADAARAAQHPQHVQDVLAALVSLTESLRLGHGTDDTGHRHPWLAVGHSCGATLLLQAMQSLMSDPPSRQPYETSHAWPPPSALLLCAGIYSLPRLVAAHPDYVAMVENAFGPDRERWQRASPAAAPNCGAWAGRSTPTVLLCHSDDDELVDWGQLQAMADCLGEHGWAVRASDWEGCPPDGRSTAAGTLVLLKLAGQHDDAWRTGDLAQRIGDALREHGGAGRSMAEPGRHDQPTG